MDATVSNRIIQRSKNKPSKVLTWFHEDRKMKNQ